MAEAGSAFVSLMPSAKGFGKNVDKQIGGDLDASGKRGGKRFGLGFKVGAAAVLTGAVVLGKFLKDSIGEARDAQKVGALTNQVIKTTGGVANVTAKQVGALSTAISLKTGIDDEAVQSGANLLLTFTNVRNEVGKGNKIFDRATQTITDMGAALGSDPKAAAIQLGKALNDPVKGMTALSRVGVSFTQGQKDTVAGMVKTGNTLGAQKIILGELHKEFGGAAAASSTFGEKAKVAFGNIQEQIGTALLPLVDGFFKLFLKSVPTITAAISGIGPAFGKIKAFVAPVAATIKGLFDSFSGSGQASALGATFAKIGSAISSNFLPVLAVMANTFTTKVLPVIRSVGAYLAANLLPIFVKVGSIIATQVVPIVASLATFLYGKLYPAVVGIVVAVGSKLKPIFDQLFLTISTKVLPTIAFLLAQFQRARPTIQRVAMVVLKVVGFLLVLAAAILGKVLPVVIRFAGFLIGALAHAIVFVIRVIARIIGNAITMGRAFVNAIQGVAKFAGAVVRLVGKVFSTVKAIPGKVRSALGNLGGTLVHAGEQLIQGLIDGIGHKIGQAVQKVQDGLNHIKHLLPGSPIKAGPLKAWNNTGPTGPAGRLMGLLADGLGNTAAVDRAMANVTGRITLASPAHAAGVSRAAAHGGGLAGQRLRLVVHGQEFHAYIDDRADSRVGSAARLSRQTARASR